MLKFCSNCGKELFDGQKFCSNCGQESVEEQKFCINCGQELREEQKFCSNCGQSTLINAGESSLTYTNTNTNINGPKNHNTYKMVVGVLMIILCFCLLSAAMQSYGDEVLFVFGLPGILGMIAAIMTICSRSNHNLLRPSGIMFIVSAGINFLAIFDLSIYAILAIVFGILNIVYCKKGENTY